MEAEQVIEEQDQKAMGEHFSEQAVMPTEADDHPIVTCECDYWGHRCPDWLWSHETTPATAGRFQ